MIIKKKKKLYYTNIFCIYVFRYKLIVDGVVGFFSLLSSILVYKKMKCSHTEPKTLFHFSLLIFDMVSLRLKSNICVCVYLIDKVVLVNFK